MSDHPPYAGLVTVGEAMLLLYNEHVGGLQSGTAFRASVAGAESNVALTAARLGTPSTWVGVLGDDAAGDLVLGRLSSGGVRTDFVRRSERRTGLLLRERRSALGSRVHYWRHDSAGASLGPDDVPCEVITQGTAVHLTGITPALGARPAAAVLAAADRAQEVGALLSLDINYRRKLWDESTARRALSELAAQADLIFATVEEAALLTGTRPSPDAASEEDAAMSLACAVQELGGGSVIIKRGQYGALVRDGSGDVIIEPAPRVPSIDTVGAGDAFVAGYLHALHAGSGTAEALRNAVRAGAWAVTVLGDADVPPTQEDLLNIDAAELDIR